MLERKFQVMRGGVNEFRVKTGFVEMSVDVA